MAQATIDIVASTTSGSDLATLLNNWRAALHSAHSGSTPPAYAVANMIWLDSATTPLYLKIYDGADWIRLFAIDTTLNVAFPLTQSPRFNFPLAGGTGNAQTITLTPAITAYTDGDVFTFEAVATNSGAATLNISGIGALAIRKMNSSGADIAVAANDILDGGRYTVNFDSAANASAGAFILVQPSLDLASLSGTITDNQLPDRLQSTSQSVTPGTGSTNGFTSGGSGFYIGLNGSSGNPESTYTYAHRYIKYSTNYGVDDAYAISAVGGVDYHYRRFYDNGTWTSWYRCYDYSAEIQSLVDNALIAIGYGAVATYAMLYRSSGPYGENGNAAGSGLIPAGCIGGNSTISSDGYEQGGFTRGGGAEAGSWNTRHRNNFAGTWARVGLWFRYA